LTETEVAELKLLRKENAEEIMSRPDRATY